MSQSVKRVVNAFVLGFVGVALTSLLNVWLDLTKALETNNWASLKTLVLSVIAGAVLAGLRAVQSYVPAVPSPEADENAKKGV